MTLEAFFEDLIKDQAKVVINTSKAKPFVELSEPGQAGCKLKISGIPSDSIVIKADYFPAPDRIFKGYKSECKRADYAIITQKNDNYYVLYVELKSSTESPSEIENQLKGARCLIGYCAEIAEHFWGRGTFSAHVHIGMHASLASTSESERHESTNKAETIPQQAC